MRHWTRTHKGELGQETLKLVLDESPDQPLRDASADPSFGDPNQGNRMSITPSVSSSSIVSAATSTVQYSMAARALLKRTDHYREAGLISFLEEKYPEIPADH